MEPSASSSSTSPSVAANTTSPSNDRKESFPSSPTPVVPNLPKVTYQLPAVNTATIAAEHANYLVNQQQYWPHYSSSVPPLYNEVTYQGQTYRYPTVVYGNGMCGVINYPYGASTTPLHQVASSLPYYLPNTPGAPWNSANEGFLGDSLRIRNIDGFGTNNNSSSSSSNDNTIPKNMRNNSSNRSTNNRRSLSPRRGNTAPTTHSLSLPSSNLFNHTGTSLVSMLAFTSGTTNNTTVSAPMSRLWENGAWNKLITLLTMYPDQRNDIPRSWGQSLFSLPSSTSTTGTDEIIRLREEVWKRIQTTLLAYAVTFQPGAKQHTPPQVQDSVSEEKKNEPFHHYQLHYDDDPAYSLDLSSLPFPSLPSPSLPTTATTSPRHSTATSTSSSLKSTSYPFSSTSASPPLPRGLLLPSLPSFITSLNLNHNNLQELPTDLPDRFPDLKKLNLAGNNLASLPNEWNNQFDTAFPSLEYLDLSDNQLTKLSTFWPTNLLYFFVGKNRITGIPVGLPSSLKELHIPNNPNIIDIYSKGKTEPRPPLPFHLHFRNLRIFDCSYTKLNSLPSILPPLLEQLICVGTEIKELPSTISNHTSLTLINCSTNRILQLPSMPSTLRFLNIQGNMIDPFWYDNRLNRIERYTTNPHVPSGCQVMDDKVHEIIGFTDNDNTWQQALWIKVSRLLSLEQHSQHGETEQTNEDKDSNGKHGTEKFSTLIDITAPAAWPCEIVFPGKNTLTIDPSLKDSIVQRNRNYVWKNICGWILQGKSSAALKLTLLPNGTDRTLPSSSSPDSPSQRLPLPLLSTLPCLPRSIQSLDLTDSHILTLPEDLSTLLPQLRCLRIQSARYLYELPTTIPVLLEELYIINCGVTKLPPTWYNMRALTPLLEIFDISGNGLETLPTRWPDNLNVLRCSSNCISNITDSLPKSLTELRIDNNPTLRFLPYGEVFGQQLKDLEILSCNNNPFLTNLPTLLPRSLLELDCHNSSIRTLPSSVGDCTKLKKLNASLCHLKHLPEEIGKCMNLEILSIHDNQLMDLPPSIAKCLRLHTLDITNNHLSTGQLVFPDSLAVLKMKGNKLHMRMIPTRLPRSLRTFECDDDVLRKWLLPAVESNHLEILLTILACLGAHIPNLTSLPGAQSPRSPTSPNLSSRGGASSPRMEDGTESPRVFHSGRLSPRGMEPIPETSPSPRLPLAPCNVSPQGLDDGENSISPKPELLLPDSKSPHSPASSSGRISPRTTMLAARSVSPRRLTEALYANLGGRISPRAPLPLLEAMAQDSEAKQQDGQHKTLLLSKDTVSLLYYALIKACQVGNAATVSALLHAGADPLLNPMPEPPNDLAAVLMNPSTTSTTTTTTTLNTNLYGANKTVGAKENNTLNPSSSSASVYFPPLSTAVLGGHAEVVAVIIEHLQELDAIDEETLMEQQMNRDRDDEEDNENEPPLLHRAATLVSQPCPYMPYKLSPLQLSIITNGKSVYGWQSLAINNSALPSSVLASLTITKVSDRKIIERKLAVLRALLVAQPDVNLPIVPDAENPKNNYFLITTDPNVTIVIPGGTPLHLAVACGFREAVAALLAAKADPNIRDSLGYVPLWYATIYATETYGDVVTALLHAGARIDTTTSSSLGGVIHQLVTLPWTIAQTVLLKITQPSKSMITNTKNSTPTNVSESPQMINTAVRYKDKELRDREIERRVEILKALFTGMRKQHSGTLTTAENSDIVFGLFTNYFAKGTTTPIHLAALSNSLPLIEIILKEMVPKLSVNNIAYLTNVTNERNETSLHCAVNGNANLPLIKCLVGSGANVRSKDNMGRTPLYLAIHNYIDTLAGISDKIDNNNNNVSKASTVGGNAEVVRKVIEYLLETGSDPLEEDATGVSPLKIAHEGAITTLAGTKVPDTVTIVPPNVMTVNGGLLFDLLITIVRNVHRRPTLHTTDIQRILGKSLLDSGTDIFTVNREGRNLAHVCAMIGNVTCMEILSGTAQQSLPPSSDGATVNGNSANGRTVFLTLPDAKGVTPLHVAIENGNVEMVHWLLKEGVEPIRVPVTGTSKNSILLSTVFERVLAYARNGTEAFTTSPVTRNLSQEQVQQQHYENISRAAELIVPLLELVLHRLPSPDATTHHVTTVPELHRHNSNNGSLTTALPPSSNPLPLPPSSLSSPGESLAPSATVHNASAASIAQQYITLADIEGIRKLGDDYHQIVRQLSASSLAPGNSSHSGSKVSLEKFEKLRHILHSAPFARLHRIMDHHAVITVSELSHQHGHTIEHGLNG